MPHILCPHRTFLSSAVFLPATFSPSHVLFFFAKRNVIVSFDFLKYILYCPVIIYNLKEWWGTNSSLVIFFVRKKRWEFYFLFLWLLSCQYTVKHVISSQEIVSNPLILFDFTGITPCVGTFSSIMQPKLGDDPKYQLDQFCSLMAKRTPAVVKYVHTI